MLSYHVLISDRQDIRIDQKNQAIMFLSIWKRNLSLIQNYSAKIVKIIQLYKLSSLYLVVFEVMSPYLGTSYQAYPSLKLAISKQEHGKLNLQTKIDFIPKYQVVILAIPYLVFSQGYKEREKCLSYRGRPLASLSIMRLGGCSSIRQRRIQSIQGAEYSQKVQQPLHK